MLKHAWIPALLASVLLPGSAKDVSFTGAAWDSLAKPLKIVPYYLRIDSKVEAAQVSMDMDLYVRGVFVKTFSTSKYSSAEKQPLKVNYALNFLPPENGKIKCVTTLNWGDAGVSYSTFEIEQSLVGDEPFANGSFFPIQPKFNSAGRFQVFSIIMGGNVSQSSDVPFDVAKAHPDSAVLVGYLRTD